MTVVGATVGRIRIIDTLGKGGMGEVYVGYDETLKRKVALKAIRSERRLDAEAKARFLREARILSQLDHPGICQIHEYIEGDDSDFLVLELIAGRQLKEALREDTLGPAFKLHVAERVTDALVAAHAKGIAHRDLKPENVMLTPEGGVKVLDFGLAYTVDEPRFPVLDEEAIGGPQRPAGGRRDRSVSGRPLTAGGGRGAPIDPAHRRSPPPDAASDPRLSGGRLADPTVVWDGRPAVAGRPAVGPAPPDAAPGRPGDPAARSAIRPTVLEAASRASDFVQTELGTIMGTVAYMSPEQARGERATVASDMYSLGLMLQELFTDQPTYEPGLELRQLLVKVAGGQTLPVNGLDPDLTALIKRLKSLAAEARPSAGETAERLAWIRAKPGRRLLRRLAAGLVVVLFLGGLKYTADLRRERNKAIAASVEAREVSEFLVGLFNLSDPNTARGDTVTARALLDVGAAQVASGELSSHPRSQARLMLTMGRVYRQLALFDPALPLLEEALWLRRELGDDELETALAIDQLASLHHDRGDYERAEPLYRQALAVREEELGSGDQLVAVSLNNLAFLYLAQSRDEAAEPLLLRTLEIQRGLLGDEDPRLAGSLNNLGDLYRSRGENERAEQLFRHAIELQENLLEADHPNLAFSLNNLAAIYLDRDEAGRAEPLFLRALAIQERVFSAGHPRVAVTLGNLAEVYAHGMTLYIDAVRQLRGEAVNQVPDAEVALVVAGSGPTPLSAAMLTREP